MGTVPQFFQPPLYWQQFEELCVGLLAEVYDLPNAQQVGRPGQAQNGVDVYGGSSRRGIIGVQCKRLADLDPNGLPYPGGPISRDFLLAEAEGALDFRPDLDIWILATTARRDVRVQRWVDDLNEDWARHQKERFAIVWSWDECISYLNSYPDLQRRYYSDVIQVRAPEDLDEIILRTIAMAFSRPAFEVQLHAENTDEFLQALKDTQKALRTGELVDRVSRHVIRKAIGGYREIEDAGARKCLARVDRDLKDLRDRTEIGLSDGSIRTDHGYLEFRNQQLAHELDQLRDQCVAGVSEVMVEAGLEPL